ncbi:MAG: hypothetical protein IPO05_17750 [Flavobacteriales bacterium]|nr:hypothetical protein [Flavobacteriales bacterium]
MNNRCAIFIFTRDAPARIGKCLTGIAASPHRKFVVDDSALPENRRAVAELCQLQGYQYLGRKEYAQFLVEEHIAESDFSFLLREPGYPDWNLSYVRNFALLLARSMGRERVWYMDDDIRVPDIGLIDELFSLLTDVSFAGAHVDGMPDQSILGHIAADVG